jgi:hypothetical protein
MANGNSGCATILVGLAVLWAVGQCTDSGSPPSTSYDPPAANSTYTPPPSYESYGDVGERDPYGDSEEPDDVEALYDDEDADAFGDETELSNSDYYTNSRGETVHSPAYSLDGSVPDGATAVCRDGSYSFSRSRRGTCSHHGGVDYWL